MRCAKYIGESLVEEYYLYDLYRDLEIETSGAVHLLLWSELMQKSGNGRLDALEFITPVIGVYEVIPVYTKEPDSFAGDKLYPTYHEALTKLTTKVLGYYLHNGSDKASYSGVELSPLPLRFANLSSAIPLYTSYSVETETMISEEWLNGKTVTGSDPAQMYKDDELYLYANEGVEIILTRDEYRKYFQLEMYINNLFEIYDDSDVEIAWYDWNSKAEQQHTYRLEWTRLTRKWIESFPMFDPSINYIP